LNDNPSSERRTGPRRAANWRVLFGPTGQLAPGFLADMSPLGVSILTEKEHPVGAEIEIHFGVEEDQSSGRFRMQGIVRHCGKDKIGVHFVNVDTTQRDHWWKIMRGEA
jgi:hypothetical protein